jgi:hypothetical protein
MAGMGVVEIVAANLKRILLSDGWHSIENVTIGKGVFRAGDTSVALSMSGESFLSFTEAGAHTVVALSNVLAFQHG